MIRKTSDKGKWERAERAGTTRGGRRGNPRWPASISIDQRGDMRDTPRLPEPRKLNGASPCRRNRRQGLTPAQLAHNLFIPALSYHVTARYILFSNYLFIGFCLPSGPPGMLRWHPTDGRPHVRAAPPSEREESAMDLIVAATRLLADVFKALKAFFEFEDSTRRRRDHTSTRRPRHLRK